MALVTGTREFQAARLELARCLVAAGRGVDAKIVLTELVRAEFRPAALEELLEQIRDEGERPAAPKDRDLGTEVPGK